MSTRYVAITKDGDNYTVDTNVTLPSGTGNVMGAAISSSETSYVIINLPAKPMLPKRGQESSSDAPTAESFESFEETTLDYDADTGSLFALHWEDIIFTDTYYGYTILKSDNHYYAIEFLSDEENRFNNAIELTFDPNLTLPNVVDSNDVPFPPNQLSVITDGNGSITYSGVGIQFCSINEYGFTPIDGHVTETIYNDHMSYQYITAGTLDVEHQTFNIARYVIEGSY